MTSSGVGVLDKASLLLSALEDEPASLAALVARTGLPRPTTHRLAIALERLDLLARDAAGRFLLGPRLAEMSVGARQSRLLPGAEPVLSRLRDVTGMDVRLHRRRGDQRVCMFSAAAREAAARPAAAGESGAGESGAGEARERAEVPGTVPVGAAAGLSHGAVAQVLLAWEAPDRIYEGLREARFNAATLSAVRRRGWAESLGEDGPGTASIAAPVHGRDDRVVAAVALSGPVTLLSRGSGRRYARHVVDAAIVLGDLAR